MSRALIAGFTVALLTAGAHSVLPAKADKVLLAQSDGGFLDQNSGQDQGAGEDQDNKKKKRKRQQEQQEQQQQQQQGQQEQLQQPQGAEDQDQGQGQGNKQRRRRQQQQEQQQQQQEQEQFGQQPQLEPQQGQDQGETKQQRRRRQQQQQQQQQQQGQEQPQGQPEPELQGQPEQQQQRQRQPQQAQPEQQPEGDQAGTRDAMRFLNDRRPARSLSDTELRRRIAVGRSLLGNRDLRDKVRGRVQSLTAEAQGELASRGGQGQSAGPGQDQGGQQGDQDQGGQQGRQDQGGQQGRQDQGGQQGRQDQGTQDQGGGQQAGGDPGRYSADRRPAATLNDRELRNRIRTGRSLLQSGQGQRGQIEARLNEDSRELRNRLQEVNGGVVPGGALDQPSAAQGEARRLLSDRRPARALDDRELRERVQRTRGVLAAEGVSNDMSERLRDRLREDRDALRDRVAEREDQRDRRSGADQGDQGDQGGFDYGGRGRSFGRDELTRRLLQDRRPSQALNVRQLNRRIGAARMALDDRSLGGPDRFRIEDGLRSDRRELRMRLIAGRRDRFDEYRREGGINIVIVPGAPPRPRPNIAAAEVDDEMIEEQLIAPPTREIDRRYSVEEIRERPALRQTMPGVEIDTIHFGFNEAFVREEEVENVERLGRILEKIVIANPDEVFMIEGHTDAVGSDPYNLDLSQQRADSVKQSLTEFFNIAPQNLETIGYGEQFLKIPTDEEEPENRRVTVRRITPLLAGRD